MSLSLAQFPQIQSKIDEAAGDLISLGKFYHQRGWCMGTSGNFSVVLETEPLLMLVTASGRDKSSLTRSDFTVVDQHGKAVMPDAPKPSAETLLHITAAQQAGAGAVLHTHSVWSTVLSQRHFDRGYLDIEGFEMLKGLSGITTHETKVSVPIFDNAQDMAEFSKLVSGRFKEDAGNMRHSYMIRKHGMHCWGKDLSEAKRHVEIMEFLLEAVGRLEGGQ